jgi:hypothetical protein
VNIVLCFNNGYGFVRIYIKKLVSLFRLFADHKISLEVNFAVCDFCFHRIWSRLHLALIAGVDIAELDIFFRSSVFVDHVYSLLSSSGM